MAGVNTSFLPALVVALAMIGCGHEQGSDDSASRGDDVIGGVDANSAKFNAVGAMVRDMPAPQPRQKFCTATLVAPTVVLTAKHCVHVDASSPETSPRYMDQSPVYFSIGPDVPQPLRQIRVTDTRISPLHRGGYTDLGSDVALYILSEAVTDITPLRVVDTPLRAADVGSKFTAMGYGVQDMALTNGTRKMGPLTLRAVKGAPAPVVFASLDEYLTEQTDPDKPMSKDDRAYYTALYKTPLLGDSQVLVGNAPGDVQVCHGDSGGPLLRAAGDTFVVAGVASWTMGTVPGTTAFCEKGAIYADFNPDAKRTIDAALAE
jgi:secreted trypsin-like serine protease